MQAARITGVNPPTQSPIRKQRQRIGQSPATDEGQLATRASQSLLRVIEGGGNPRQRAETRSTAAEDSKPTIGGINQSVNLLGKTFHAQTELCGGAIRTEIFLGGRVVATREQKLEGDKLEGGKEAMRAHLLSYHKKVLSGLLDRASSYQGLQSAPASSGNARSHRQQKVEPAGASVGPREAPLDSEKLELGLRVRHLFEQLWERLGTNDSRSEKGWGDRLERASRAFAWIRKSPIFTHTRIAEQVRIEVLQQQVGEWLDNGRDSEKAAQLWSAIEALSRYTAEINNRADLVAFDRRSRAEAPGSGHETAEDPGGRSSDIPSTEVQATSDPRPGSPEESAASPRLEKENMATIDLDPLSDIDGFLGACLVDSGSGMVLGAASGGTVNLEVAAAGTTEVVRAERLAMSSLELNDGIEDILITLGRQYHVIRPLGSAGALFLYLIVDRKSANLAMARHELKDFESTLDFI